MSERILRTTLRKCGVRPGVKRPRFDGGNSTPSDGDLEAGNLNESLAPFDDVEMMFASHAFATVVRAFERCTMLSKIIFMIRHD
jgi:hypothetical protein